MSLLPTVVVLLCIEPHTSVWVCSKGGMHSTNNNYVLQLMKILFLQVWAEPPHNKEPLHYNTIIMKLRCHWMVVNKFSAIITIHTKIE